MERSVIRDIMYYMPLTRTKYFISNPSQPIFYTFDVDKVPKGHDILLGHLPYTV